MPFDQKRINGPESSFSYRQFIKRSKKSTDQLKKAKEKRVDNRDLLEHRKIAVELDVISKAKGSCYIENGNTKIICGVFELREISRNYKYADKGQLYCDFKYAPFAKEQRKSISDHDEKLMSNNIKSALESVVCLFEFPNFQMDVFIMVLQDDGSVLSTSIMAASMAFVDASISCFDILVSSSVALINGKMIVDPTGDEEDAVISSSPKENHGIITMSSLNSMDQISHIFFNGHVDVKLLKEAKKQLLEVNNIHINYLKKIISMKILKENR